MYKLKYVKIENNIYKKVLQKVNGYVRISLIEKCVFTFKLKPMIRIVDNKA